jgi:hypothetical protein
MLGIPANVVVAKRQKNKSSFTKNKLKFNIYPGESVEIYLPPTLSPHMPLNKYYKQDSRWLINNDDGSK